MLHTHITPMIRRVLIADFILFILSFLAYVIQVAHSRRILLLNPNELLYNNPTLVRIRNWRSGSLILTLGATAVLSMIVILIVSSYLEKVSEILIWIEMGLLVLWALASYFKQPHVVNMVFSFLCLAVYVAFFSIIFAHTN